MDNRIRESFGEIHASRALRQSAMQAVARRAERESARPGVRRLLPALAAVLILCLGGLGWLWFTPVSAISVDVNPSLELVINRFGRVLTVEGWNEDGRALAQQLDLRFQPYVTALERVVDSEAVQECLARGEELCITVAGGSAAQSRTILEAVRECANGAYCMLADYAQLEEAHAAGLSLGKYRVFLELQALDPSVRAADAARMTMRELRERIEQLGGDPVQPGGQGKGQGNGAGNGKGHGGGPGNGWNQGSQGMQGDG